SKMSPILSKYIEKQSQTPKKERNAAFRSAVKAQVCDVLRHVLPVATKSTVGIYGSAQAIENLIMNLSSDNLKESQLVGSKILENIRKVAPIFYERADIPERGGATIAYKFDTREDLKKITNKYLKESYSNDLSSVHLVDYTPKNEFELIPYMLYEQSSLSISELKTEIANWSYEKKQKVFEAYMGKRLNRRHRPGRAIENAVYSWDIICDYGIFRDLQRHRMVNDLVWQDLSPRYGYDIPELIEKTNLSDDFVKCFDLSMELYSLLQSEGYNDQAQYATLLGHKMRWHISYNAREAFHIHELRTSPQGHPEYRKLVLEMHQKLAEVHPLLAEAMIFVNKAEDPELTRLAAERYSQIKLSRLK
ncbi:MAG TPA: FAD-dependent thymidylate synthase, partial [Candidatus Saccharimonadia bacterium]|nr:FAD-dependent thymidylate synthase [Candidatus Saccharimonadia bacterium]